MTLEESVLQAVNPRRLELIVLPTEKCNFRCFYCYESFEFGRMQREVVDGLKLFMSQRLPSLDFFKLSWFGGEPLLAKDIVEEVSAHAFQLSADGKKFEFNGNMTTNAYLLDQATMLKLNAVGIRHFQITLDGNREDHDAVRIQANGRPSFDNIWKNLLSFKSLGIEFEVTLRLHYTPSSVESVQNLIRNIRNEFENDGRFQLFLKEVAKLGGPNDGHILEFSSEDKSAALQRLIESVGPQMSVTTELDGLGHCCYASTMNSFVIRSTGRIGKCTVALNRAGNDLGYLSADGRFLVDNVLLRRWASGLASLDEGQLACPASTIDLDTGSMQFPNPSNLGERFSEQLRVF